MRTMFSLEQDEITKLEEWVSKKKKINVGPIGGRYIYCFTPTSVGVALTVKDCIDDSEINLTDYTKW